MLTWFGQGKTQNCWWPTPVPATVADVCAGADSAKDGTRACRRLWLPFIPPLTRKYLLCNQGVRQEALLHTQEVHGSSPCAPTIFFNNLPAELLRKVSTMSAKVGG